MACGLWPFFFITRFIGYICDLWLIMKVAPVRVPALIIIALIIVSFSGCFTPEHKITPTVAPTVGTPEETITPTAAPTPGIAHPTVTVSGRNTVVKGTKDGLARGIRLDQGVYVVSCTGSGTYLSFSLADLDGNGVMDISKGKTEAKKLFIIDGVSVYAGEFSLVAASDSDWAVTIARPDAASAASLTLTASCDEQEGAVIGPFNAHGGILKIGYTFSRTPYADGTVSIYDVSTGNSFYTRPMTGGSQLGQSNAEVPSNGVYIAQVNMPPGAAYGDFTLSQ
jgi:hypothetical protein